jgi:hypothetical protein
VKLWQNILAYFDIVEYNKMETKGERREQKRERAWYKKHMANNRKALEVIIQAKEARLKRIAYDWYEIEYLEVL